MSRAGRNFDVSRFSSIQVITVVLFVITWECDAKDNLKCSEGVCVPSYLCSEGSKNIKTAGEQLLDLRVQENECPGETVCCGVEDGSVGNYDSLSEDRCDGECVKESDCSSATDAINLRFGRNACGPGEVCCKDHPRKVCQGKCVFRNECSDHADDPSIINLRFENSGCPANQMCCKNVKINYEKPSNHAEQVECEGKCLKASQCPTSAVETINLRLSNGCSFDEVCCLTAEPLQCNGTCTSMDRCADDSVNYTSVNLRLMTSNDCPLDQICCQKLKQNFTPACNGECVAVYQCPELDTWKSSINLRLLNTDCPFQTVCCKSPNLEICVGTCVSQVECSDTTQLDLRLSMNCPFNKVCCKKLRSVTPTADVSDCNGACVSLESCPEYSENTDINLRFADGSCPNNQICCPMKSSDSINLSTPLESGNACEGTCLPRNQCSDVYSNYLRNFNTLCPNNQLCCKVPKLSTSCDGTCVTNDQCLDYPLINLRFSNTTNCPNNQICCKNLRHPQPSCKGRCAPIGKCPKKSSKFSSIDLRLTGGICPSGTECCQDIESCDGKCVRVDQCDDTQRVNMGLLRPELCPMNQVCCKKLKNLQPSKFNVSATSTSNGCDGSCVPGWQCASSDIDLRVNNGICPTNEVCCKAQVPPCPGQCVLPEHCEDVGINLRYVQNSCAKNKVCCRSLKQQTCPGQCVPVSQCSFGKPDKSIIDLRLPNNGCSGNTVCCMTPTPFQMPAQGSDVPPPSTTPTGSSCTLDPESKLLKKPDVKWLVNIWKKQEILGILRRQFACTGTLLKSDLVLTSADCVKNMKPEDIFVRIDDFNLKPLATLSPRREFKVTKIIPHPDYSSTDRTANLAVLHLAKNATRSTSICLPSQSPVDAEDLCFLIGWNSLNLVDDTTQYATPDKLPVFALATGAKCDEGYICSEDRKQSKQGQCADAFQGSPVVCFIGKSSSWVQIALTAAGNRKCNDVNVPRSFVSIVAYESWIQEQIVPSFLQIETPSDPKRMYLPPLVHRNYT